MTPGQVRLYKNSSHGSRPGSWELLSVVSRYEFIDSPEADGKPNWSLELDSGLAVLVVDCFCVYQKRFELAVDDSAYRLEFPATDLLQEFSSQYGRKLFENTHGVRDTPGSRKKVHNDSSALNPAASAQLQQQWDQGSDEQPAEGEPHNYCAVAEPGDKVHSMCLGAKDNSFLVRENIIDVLGNNLTDLQVTDRGFEVKTPAGQCFTPSKVMLMGAESKMNMLSPSADDVSGARSLYHTDLTSNKVVSEWKFEKDGVELGMRDLASSTRGAQLEDTSTFIALGRNRLDCWDTRTKQGAVQEFHVPQGLDRVAGHPDGYSPKESFRCLATSGKGYIVTGSNDGVIRMYNGDTAWNRAKTQVYGAGSAITAVDVTYDGNWVLATTESHMVVIKATIKDDGGNEVSGFKQSISKTATARLLKLKPEDQALLKGEPLKQGRFTWVTEEGTQERFIVASCGKVTLRWNFRVIKQAKATTTSCGGVIMCTQYQKYTKQESVVDSAFMGERWSSASGTVVVATKHQLHTLSK